MNLRRFLPIAALLSCAAFACVASPARADDGGGIVEGYAQPAGGSGGGMSAGATYYVQISPPSQQGGTANVTNVITKVLVASNTGTGFGATTNTFTVSPQGSSFAPYGTSMIQNGGLLHVQNTNGSNTANVDINASGHIISFGFDTDAAALYVTPAGAQLGGTLALEQSWTMTQTNARNGATPAVWTATSTANGTGPSNANTNIFFVQATPQSFVDSNFVIGTSAQPLGTGANPLPNDGAYLILTPSGDLLFTSFGYQAMTMTGGAGGSVEFGSPTAAGDWSTIFHGTATVQDDGAVQFMVHNPDDSTPSVGLKGPVSAVDGSFAWRIPAKDAGAGSLWVGNGSGVMSSVVVPTCDETTEKLTWWGSSFTCTADQTGGGGGSGAVFKKEAFKDPNVSYFEGSGSFTTVSSYDYTPAQTTSRILVTCTFTLGSGSGSIANGIARITQLGNVLASYTYVLNGTRDQATLVGYLDQTTGSAVTFNLRLRYDSGSSGDIDGTSDFTWTFEEIAKP